MTGCNVKEVGLEPVIHDKTWQHFCMLYIMTASNVKEVGLEPVLHDKKWQHVCM